MVFAGYVGTGALAESALTAMRGAVFIVGRQQRFQLLSLLVGELFFGDCLATSKSLASSAFVGCTPSLLLFAHGRRWPRNSSMVADQMHLEGTGGFLALSTQ